MAKRLKTAREAKNLRQNEASNLLGISASTLAGYETGHRKPDVDMLSQLARLYDVSMDFLATGALSSESPVEVELREILLDASVKLDGVQLSKADKAKINDVLTGLFWETIHPRDKIIKRDQVPNTHKAEEL